MTLTLYRKNETEKNFYIPKEKKEYNISNDLKNIITEMIFDDYYQSYSLNGIPLYTIVFSYTRFKENDIKWEKIYNEFLEIENKLTINELEELLNTYQDLQFEELFNELFISGFFSFNIF